MSDILHTYQSASGSSAVYLPFSLDEIIRDWAALRPFMARQKPDAYTRDEWAYLISFLEPANLNSPFEQSFGKRSPVKPEEIVRVFRRRGDVSIWLPGNVSLLGPLTMILLSLTGNRIRMKGATGSQDLTAAFLEFARARLKEGSLLEYLRRDVQHAVFDRYDDRNTEMSATANVRIAFGSNEAVRAIHALPHPIDSVGIVFADRQSEAWIEKGAVSAPLLKDLLKVFVVYGQAGCTSPRRAVIIGATSAETRAIRDRVLAMWNDVLHGDPAPHVASENIMSRQCAAAWGWDAVLAPRNTAVLATGEIGLRSIPGRMVLSFVPGSLAEAVDSLPEQIQTVGYGISPMHLDETWLATLGRTRIDRFVPIGRMHHFGPVWDGQAFWREAFDEVEVVQ